MLQFTCPGCGSFLANVVIPFSDERERIKASKMSDEEKHKATSKALDSYDRPNYCCRQLLLTFIDQSGLVD